MFELQITSTVAESLAVRVRLSSSFAVTVAIFVVVSFIVVVQLHIIDSLTANVSFEQATFKHLSSVTFISVKLLHPVFVTL